MGMTDILLLLVGLAAAAAALAAALIAARSVRAVTAHEAALEDLREAQRELASSLEEVYAVAVDLSQGQHTASALDRQRFDTTSRLFSQSAERVEDIRRDMAQHLAMSRESLDNRMDKVRDTVERQLLSIREDNARQLEQMRETVDQKLSRTLSDRLSTSFRQVSEQLEAVYKGLGDMQGIAAGVGDLKRVLGNVKARGILGEVQLGAILSDILTPDQYLENVATKPGSTERVEFAVKLPVEDGDPVLLPIDSKFPGHVYEHLLDALDSGDGEAVAAARKRLEGQIRAEARDISQKYLSVPETTGFGIMFLPFEGLYAEVVSRPGLVEALSREFRVNVAGPSTMAALLNSLQMSYQTFKLQSRTDDVLRVLAAVKAELPRYQHALRQAQRQIETAGKTVDSIITTRTNVMERKLKSIDALAEEADVDEVLGLEPVSEAEEA